MKTIILTKPLMITILSFILFTGAHAADMSTEQAFNELSPQAISKLREAKIDVNALLNNDKNDLIINYNKSNYMVDNSPNEGKKLATQRFKAVKDKIRSELKDAVLLRDYYGSPVSFYRVNTREDLVTLLNSETVVSIQPNINVKASLTESLPFIKQPETANTYLKSQTGTHYFKGKGSVVAIIDTGLDATHPEFGNCVKDKNDCSVLTLLEFAQDDNGKTDGKLEDSSVKHGTNVSAITLGVAPEAKVVSLDVFGWQYNTTKRKYEHLAPSYAITGALNWIYNNHTSRNPKGLNIVSLNMSLGGGYEQKVTNTIPLLGDLKQMGVASIVASGNEYYTDAIAWPASEENAISVGAVHDINYSGYRDNCGSYGIKQGAKPDDLVCFSNSGSLLDILAPGYNITAGGVTLSGTSMAAPHVAGAYAVLRSPDAIKFTGDTVDDTTNRLKRGGVKVKDFRNGLVRPRLNLFDALMTMNKG